MQKTAIILHGMPSREGYFRITGDSESNSHRIPRLQKQLNIHHILTQTPEMPEPWKPNYEKRKNIFERFEINDQTILIGYSCGGGFLIRWLSENTVKVNKIILIAPWINSQREEDITMFDDLKINKDLANKAINIKIFSSDNDDQVIKDSIEILKNEIHNIQIFEFKNYGHFCFKDMKTREFPELLNECLN